MKTYYALPLRQFPEFSGWNLCAKWTRILPQMSGNSIHIPLQMTRLRRPESSCRSRAPKRTGNDEPTGSCDSRSSRYPLQKFLLQPVYHHLQRLSGLTSCWERMCCVAFSVFSSVRITVNIRKRHSIEEGTNLKSPRSPVQYFPSSLLPSLRFRLQSSLLSTLPDPITPINTNLTGIPNSHQRASISIGPAHFAYAR